MGQKNNIILPDCRKAGNNGTEELEVAESKDMKFEFRILNVEFRSD